MPRFISIFQQFHNVLKSDLRLMNTPEEFISIGSTYFRIELIALVITFFNNIYIAIERARGNSKRILYIKIFH